MLFFQRLMNNFLKPYLPFPFYKVNSGMILIFVENFTFLVLN